MSSQQQQQRMRGSPKRRGKRVSEYQASDDEMMEFEKLESQLISKDSSKDVRQKLSSQDVRRRESQKGVVEQKKQAKVQDAAPVAIAEKETPKDEKEGEKQKKGICYKIFCCGGGCCNKKNAENEKNLETNLSKPQKALKGQTKTGKGVKETTDGGGLLEEEEIVEGGKEEVEAGGRSEEEQVEYEVDQEKKAADEGGVSHEASILISVKSGSEQMEKKELEASDEDQDAIDDEEIDSPDEQSLPSRSPNQISEIQIPEEQKLSEGNQAENEEEEKNEDESDKTQDNEDDTYKKAQAKKMFIIQEVDEDQFSDSHSIQRDRSIVQQRLESSMQHETKLEPLEEEEAENQEEKEVLNAQANNTFQDASQDIEPSMINNSLEAKKDLKNEEVAAAHSRMQRASTGALIEKVQKQEMKDRKSKTWDEKVYDELEIDAKDEEQKRKSKAPKSLVNFKEYMESEEKKQMLAKEGENGNNQLNFRPNKKVQNYQNMQSSEPFAQADSVMIIEDFESQRFDNNSPVKDIQSDQHLRQQRLRSPDKSKMSSAFYANFDQFMEENQEPVLVTPQKHEELKELSESDKADPNETLKSINQSKEEALKKSALLKERESKLKKQQVSAAKEKAKKMEESRSAKLKSILLIQKMFKGHLQRKEFKVMKANLQAIKGFRKMVEQSHSNYQSENIRDLVEAIKSSKQKQIEDEQKLLTDFLSLCATNLQKAWRGFIFRKKELPQMRKEKKALETIKAFVQAWRVRKVMQNKEIFVMGQYIKDLTKVQEYFVYVEKSENLMLLKQLKKDRRKAIEGFVDEIENLSKDGQWIKGYIGNKIQENMSSMDTEDGAGPLSIKQFEVSGDEGELKQLICTERFLYDDEIQRNPYLFESDEFVRQKFLERRYHGYSQVNIHNSNKEEGEFVKMQQQMVEGNKGRKTMGKAGFELDIRDSDSSRFESDAQTIQVRGQKKNKSTNKKMPATVKSENPRDKVAVPNPALTFEQMLEQAIKDEDNKSEEQSLKIQTSRTATQNKAFLKKKPRYDAKKSIERGKGSVKERNIEKKRLFGSKSKGRGEQEESEAQVSVDEAGYESRGTFKNIIRKSFVQKEATPKNSNKTVLPPSLTEKLYEQFQKAQMFLRSDKGQAIRSKHNSQYKPLEKPQAPLRQKPSHQHEDLDVVLGLEELEKIYQIYHGDDGQENDFFRSKRVDAQSKVPHLRKQALFFNCYDDSVFESVLEELKQAYGKEKMQHRKWMMVA